MVTEPNADAEELKQSLFQEDPINIFDVFAALYLYCEPRFNTIRLKLADKNVFRRVSLDAQTLESSLLPPVKSCLVPIGFGTRKLVESWLDSDGGERDFDSQCFTFLRAIDNAYYSTGARGISLSNFPTLPQELNLNIKAARVYPKRPSPIYRLVQHNIESGSKMGITCGILRRGRDVGDHLRDYLDNLACVALPDGYHVDLNGLDSPTRLNFPEDLSDCRVALIPLTDQTSCLTMQLFDLDSQNKKPFLCTGLSEADKVAGKARLLLQHLSEKHVTLVIFPELCSPELVRKVISEGFKENLFPDVKMVIVGSTHEELDGKWHNVAYVFGEDGRVLWNQRKLQPYTLKGYEAARLSSLHHLADSDLYEKISTVPKVLVVRDTPLGRMAVLICRDLLFADQHRKVLFDIGVNCIVVPAMSKVLYPDFTLAAEQFAIHTQCTTFLSNWCALAREAVSENGDTNVKVSFAFVPGYPSIWWCECNVPAGECVGINCSDNFTLRLGSWPSNFE